MAHLQNWFGLLPPDIATILPWSESLDKPLDVLHFRWPDEIRLQLRPYSRSLAETLWPKPNPDRNSILIQFRRRNGSRVDEIRSIPTRVVHFNINLIFPEIFRHFRKY